MMYEWPTTQPMSEVVNMVSPGLPQKMCFIDAASATAYPPTSRCTPHGRPVVPYVYRMYDGSEDSSQTQSIFSNCPPDSSFQSTSRPLTNERDGSSPRLKSRTFFGGCLASLIDSSTSAL